MKNKEFVIFDVETTGLSPSMGDRIIEIAALRMKNGKAVDQFHSLVDPEREISYEAFLVNGISSEMLIGAPRAAEILPRFLKFTKGACLVGHNIGFDLGFLNHELCLMGLDLDSNISILDTLRMARGLLPAQGSYSLLMVARTLGIAKEQKHRAMSDVRLTYEVFLRLLDFAQEKSINTINTLLRLFGANGKEGQDEELENITLIEEAIKSAKALNLSYFSGSRASVTKRKIIPKKLIRKRGKLTLVAFCHLRNEERDFRVDRILHLEKF